MRFLLFVLLTVFPCVGVAKPLIQSSEDTLASVCLEFGDTSERIIEICKLALDEANEQGSSQRQVLQMRRTLGDAYQDLGKYESALVEYRAVLDIDPNFGSAHLGVGWSEYGLGNYVVAREALDKAYAFEVSASAVAALASVKFVTDEITLDQYLEQMEVAIAILPTYSWAIRESGWKLYENGRPQDAVEYFSRALELYPEDYNAFLGRARSQVYLDGNAALNDVNRAIELVDNDPYAYNLRFEILTALERYRQSMADAEWLIENTPEISDGYVQKARALDSLGRGKAAISLLRDTMLIEDLDGQEYLNYWAAGILVDNDKTAEAEVQLRKNFELYEPDKHDMRLLAYILLFDHRPAEAAKYVDDALELDPNWALLHGYKARVLAHAGKPKKAMDTYERAFELGAEDWILDDFIATLVSEGLFLQAIAARRRFSRS